MNAPPVVFEAGDAGFCFKFADALLAYQARKLFMAYLQGQVATDGDLYLAEVIVGELVSNVARHAPGAIEVQALWREHGVRLNVVDFGPGYDLNVSLPDDPLDESHRGHFLVGTLGGDLRVERRDGATITSVTLPVRRRP